MEVYVRSHGNYTFLGGFVLDLKEILELKVIQDCGSDCSICLVVRRSGVVCNSSYLSPVWQGFDLYWLQSCLDQFSIKQDKIKWLH